MAWLLEVSLCRDGLWGLWAIAGRQGSGKLGVFPFRRPVGAQVCHFPLGSLVPPIRFTSSKVSSFLEFSSCTVLRWCMA